jgi:hypothetical protein
LQIDEFLLRLSEKVSRKRLIKTLFQIGDDLLQHQFYELAYKYFKRIEREMKTIEHLCDSLELEVIRVK